MEQLTKDNMEENTKNPRKYEYEIPAGYAARIENNRVIIEPKESEGEMIRKEIIEFLTDGIWSETTIGKVKQSQRYAKWIAYLEKMEEQKPAEWSKQSIIDTLTKWLTEKIAPLHKKSLDGTITEKEEMFEAALLEMRSLVNSPEFQIGKDTPSEWSEDIICKAVKEVGLTHHQIDWLKNNVFPPEQEWSEEDYQPKQKRCQRCGGEGIITVYNHYEDLDTGVEHKEAYERICPDCGGKGFIKP